jgi:hypothetical protein
MRKGLSRVGVRSVVSIGLVAALFLGCGSEGPPAVPVAGTITYKGKPIEMGTIMFFPKDGKHDKVAAGEIKDGKFTLSTYQEGDGAPAGVYRVTIQSTKEVTTPGGDTNLESLLPPRFGDPDRAPFEATIPRKGTPDLKLDIE